MVAETLNRPKMAAQARSPDDELPIAFVGTYPPRQCGIATFTQDVSEAMRAADPAVRPTIIALNDAGGPYDYPEHVRFEVRQGVRGDYARAADFINFSDIRLVSIQHEYGIFGGDGAMHILDLLARLRKPAIATLHTVLNNPSRAQREIVRRMADRCARLVVMSERAVGLLRSEYGVSGSKVAVIPHGIPEMPYGEPAEHKARFGVEGRRVLLTFGLISPVKGIETVIRALPPLVERFPDLVYFVVGQTHPAVRRRFGEEYRSSLEREAEALGVRDHVVFRNRFVPLGELCEYLRAADVYITPYLHEAQITSGTLAYAMGAGAAVVSTRYWHAAELLAEGRGRLFGFGDHRELSRTLAELLGDPAELARVRRAGYDFSRSMTWPRVGGAYVDLARRLLRAATAPAAPADTSPGQRTSMPELRLDHLLRLTDDTGVLRHARHSIPDRRGGYWLDDSARALIVALGAHRVVGSLETERLISTCLAFLHHAQDAEGGFHPSMSYNRTLGTGPAPRESVGRALWALGTAVEQAPDRSGGLLAKQMFDRAIERAGELGVRGRASAMLGLTSYLTAEPGHAAARAALRSHADELTRLYDQQADASWRWFEPEIGLDAALVPLALFDSHRLTRDEAAGRVARQSLAFLESICFAGEHLSLIGNAGWYRRGGERPIADELPIDAAAFVLAFRGAYRATGERHYLRRMRDAFEWFLGTNRLGESLYDFSTAGCRDGLGERDPSLNQGAESTVAFLLALLAMLDLPADQFDEREPEPATAAERHAGPESPQPAGPSVVVPQAPSKTKLTGKSGP